MIIQFRFSQYHSFRQPCVVQMRAAGSKTHPQHLASLPCGPLLKNLAVYGPNSSGKSQLISAFHCYFSIVRRQLPDFFPSDQADSLFLGAFISHYPPDCENIVRSFLSFFRNSFLFFDNTCLFRTQNTMFSGSETITRILDQQKARMFIFTHLHAMGLSLPPKTDNPLPVSTGLTKVILLLYALFCLSRSGGVLLADDLTAFLHHNVTSYLLRLVHNRPDPPVQLIFTTHDVSFLNRDQFRRDQIAVIHRDPQGTSRLHTLADLRVRSDANFSREYLEGRYDAVPAWEENGSPAT